VYKGDESDLVFTIVKEILESEGLPYEVGEPDDDTGYVSVYLKIEPKEIV
jgi:hypothetical protein